MMWVWYRWKIFARTAVWTVVVVMFLVCGVPPHQAVAQTPAASGIGGAMAILLRPMIFVLVPGHVSAQRISLDADALPQHQRQTGGDRES